MAKKYDLSRQEKELAEENEEPHLKWKSITPSKTLVENFEKNPTRLQLIILAGSMLIGLGLIIIAMNDFTNNFPLIAIGVLIWGVVWAFELPTYLSLRRVKK